MNDFYFGIKNSILCTLIAFIKRDILIFSIFLFSISSLLAQNSGLTLSSSKGTTRSISQYGITWFFEDEVEFGQYITGDFWVKGPVTITGISPQSTYNGSDIINGSMSNIAAGSLDNGFDSRIRPESYFESLNIAWEVNDNNPYIANPGESITSCISNTNSGRKLITLAVLTVVAQAPPIDSFRPPYVGTNKEMSYTYNDVITNRLTNLTVYGTPPTWDWVEQQVERPFIDFAVGWNREYIHGNELNNLHYGRDLARVEGAVTLMLLSNYPIEQKRKSLIGVIQQGIDVWGIYKDAHENGRSFNWRADGGHSCGRKWMILFAGYMLNDSEMLNVGNIPELIQEDQMFFYVNQRAIDITQGGMSQVMKDRIAGTEKWNTFQANYPEVAAKTGTWVKDARDAGFSPFQQGHLGLPEWDGGSVSGTDFNAYWVHMYRMTAAMGLKSQVLSALILDLKTEWNHNPIFDYMHRFVEIEKGSFSKYDPWEGDPYAAQLGMPDVDGSPSGTNWHLGFGEPEAWIQAMWDAYWYSHHTLDDWINYLQMEGIQ